jgi:hypothetical protein
MTAKQSEREDLEQVILGLLQRRAEGASAHERVRPRRSRLPASFTSR